ncbi:MAG: glycosyltransferase family 4 protein, partial [Nitrososphaerota archaeon]|nr:glycosyltransferase family 4 protein [Nitrososphaerota archaeon]
ETNKSYDAVFIGRLHPQKGVLELIEIWNAVLKMKPNCRLAIIGNGYLESEMRNKCRELGIDRSVTFYGFLDGDAKTNVFVDSKVVLHPAIYDSGGMAAAEAMAFGLPGVGFDLLSLRSYYPKGMLKAKCFDVEDFASQIVNLLEDRTLYSNLSKEAYEFSKTWDWNSRSEFLYTQISNLVDQG